MIIALVTLAEWGVASLVGPSRSVQAAGIDVFRLSLADPSLGLHLETGGRNQQKLGNLLVAESTFLWA